MNNKIIIIFSILLLPFLSTGQTDSINPRKISLSLSVGNNGQVDNSIKDFYRQNSEYLNFLFNSPNSKQTELKYNLLFSYTSKKRILYGIKLGYQLITNEYSTSRYDSEVKAKSSQSIYNCNPYLGYVFDNKKFDFILGLQIPLFLVGEYNYSDTENHYRSNSSGIRELQYISESTTTINGGYITGLNSFLMVKFLVSKRFYLMSDISVGVLHSSMGRTLSTETTTTYYGTFFPGFPANYTSSDSDYTLKKTYFSAPEFSLGLGFKF